MNVAVLGASDDPERYSHKAVMLLRENGHAVFPVNPKLKTVEGLPVYPSLGAIQAPIDTLSVYVSSAVSAKLADEILALHPRRILFNPGAENPELASRAQAQGIHTREACTLVLLRTHQFDKA